ncbi:MAG: hypothetical protein HZA80_02995 [Candidatus Taylorbacteria bacterium]|nr:hypothetical protein [Candidatus Taylorbacteria bacterium]
MPKIVFNIPHNTTLVPADLLGAGKQIIHLVAKACSTDERQLTQFDVDWIVNPLPHGSIAGMGIELYTIGFPDRRKKLENLDVLRKLKADIIGVLREIVSGLPPIKDDDGFLWVQFTDGPHV